MPYLYCLIGFITRLPCGICRFGRDYSQIIKVFNTALDFVYAAHAHKVVGNIFWYYDRLDMYNQCICVKIAGLNNGQIPGEVDDIYGFLDGTSHFICRPGGHFNIRFRSLVDNVSIEMIA